MATVFLFAIFTLANILLFGDLGAGSDGRHMTGLLVTNAFNPIPSRQLGRLRGMEPLLMTEAQGLDTQILLGERISNIRSHTDATGEQWAEVALLDQPKYSNGVWVPKVTFIKQQHCLPRSIGWEANARVINMVTSVYASKNIKSMQLGVLSMGTPVRVKNSFRHGWVEIELASGLVGNVAASDVVTDKFLARVSVANKRDLVVAAAAKFENTPYRWGGASGFNGDDTGVDCSGEVLRAYQAIGFKPPRDSHDQFMVAAPVKFGTDLQPADLIFFAKITAQKTVKVIHVVMVVDDHHLIEATGMCCYSNKEFEALSEFDKTQVRTRIIDPREHKGIKQSFAELWNGQMNKDGDMLIFLGTFLGDGLTRKRLMRGLIE